ncbi:hypothetical protein AALB39_17665 [Lachnospiraceae bacterium 54-53]
MEETIKLDRERVREDFMGLYSDIAAELFKHNSDCVRLIYDYTEMMNREQQFFTPKNAYEAGLHAPEAKFEQGFVQYIRKIYLDPENLFLLQKRDDLFYKLCGLLGDANGLMTEFNDLYRRCNGIISKNIDCFFRMGFEQSHIKAGSAV